MNAPRCFLVLVLVLCCTSLAKGGRPRAVEHTLSSRLSAAVTSAQPTNASPTWTLPSLDQVQNPDAGFHLRLRRLAAAASAPPIHVSPTWALPSFDPMQMAADLGKNLAAATNSLGSKLMTLTGQSSAAAVDDQTTFQAQVPLEPRSAPTPAPVSAVPSPAIAPTAASQETAISMAAPAPQAAPAPSSAVPASAPAPAPAVARQAAVTMAPAAALAPAAASEEALISMTGPAPAPAAASREAIINATTATPEAAQTTRELYDTQVDQLADMIASVFMVHSASQLNVFDHLNTSHAITAAELAVGLFWDQVEGYINGTANLVKNLPQEVASLPQNISDAAASQQLHMAQANSASYLLESFHKLVHDLEEPLGISGGGSVFSYNPCFINTSPVGISLSATGVNIGAPLVGISPTGISINPQGLNIQPTLISVSPTGVNVSPQGLNIAPALIAVSPGRVSINPQGGNIGGSLISVSAAPPP